MGKIDNSSRFSDLFLSKWHPFAWIVAAIVLLYFRSIFFGFTHLDDKDLIVDNSGFIGSIGNISQAFMFRVFPKILVPYYRPILTVSFMVDSAIGGTQPFFYHITNIVIHCGVSSVLFLLLLRLGVFRLPAFFFTILFAVHPALVQAVAWIPGRNDSLLAFSVMASFIYFMKFLRDTRKANYFIHMLLFAFALFTKETAIAMIPVCLIYTKTIDRKPFLCKEMKMLMAGWTVTACAWHIMRQVALEGSFKQTLTGLSEAFLVSTPAVIQYTGKIFMPFNLSVFPTIKDTVFIYGILAVILIISGLISSRDKRWPFVLFGLSWFLLFLGPSLLRISAGLVQDFQEHRMYLPIAGMIIVINEIDLFKKIQWKRLTAASFIAVFFMFALINVRHTGNFRDKFSYWRNAASTAPNLWLTHQRLACMYYDDGMFEDAIKEFRAAIKINRLEPSNYALLGHTYLAMDKIEDAEFEFRRAVAAYDGNYPSLVALGAIYYRQGKAKEAQDMWLKALKLEPDDIVALKNMAIFCADQKNYKVAMHYVRRLRSLGAEIPEEFLKKIGALK